MTEYRFRWLTVDFKPIAESGWRALYLPGPEGWTSAPVAGWLVQEEAPNPANANTRVQRVIAAVLDEFGEAEAVMDTDRFWKVLGPGEADPTPKEEAFEREMNDMKPITKETQ